MGDTTFEQSWMRLPIFALAVVNQGAAHIVRKTIANELRQCLSRLVNAHAVQIELRIKSIFPEPQVFEDTVLDAGSFEIQNIEGINRVGIIAKEYLPPISGLGDSRFTPLLQAR